MLVYFGSLTCGGVTIKLNNVNPENIADVIAQVEQIETTSSNKQEVLTRLKALQNLFEGKIVLACNANYNKITTKKKVFNSAYIWKEGALHYARRGHPTVPTPNMQIELYEVSKYTPIPTKRWLKQGRKFVYKYDGKFYSSFNHAYNQMIIENYLPKNIKPLEVTIYPSGEILTYKGRNESFTIEKINVL